MPSEPRENSIAGKEELLFSGQYLGHRAGVRTIAVSADGVWIATADSNRGIILRKRGEVHYVFDPLPFWQRYPSNRRVHAMAFSLDSTRLFVALTDQLTAYEVESGNRLWRDRGRRILAFLGNSPLSLAVHPIRGFLATSFEDGHLGFWSPDGSSRDVWFDNAAPRQLAFSRDGARLIGTDGYSVSIWDVVSHAKIARHIADEKVHSIALSPVADVVATRTLYRTNIWNLETGMELGSIQIGQGLPLIAFSPVSERLALSENSIVRVFRFDGSQVAEAALPETIALSLAYSADGSEILVGRSDGVVDIFAAP